MKAATIINRYQALGQYIKTFEGMAEKLTVVRPSVLDALDSLLMWGYVRPQVQTGSGRFTRLKDLRNEIKAACENILALDLVMLNDAPRGGRTGDIWFIKDGWVPVVDNYGQECFHAIGLGYNTRAVGLLHWADPVSNFLLSCKEA